MERVEQQARRIRQLLDRIEELDGRLQALEAALFEGVDTDSIAVLSRTEQMLVALLLQRVQATREQLWGVLYGGRPDADGADPKIIDVFVHRVRRKLAPLGIEIQAIYGVGYAMPDDSKRKLRRQQEAA